MLALMIKLCLNFTWRISFIFKIYHFTRNDTIQNAKMINFVDKVGAAFEVSTYQISNCLDHLLH